MRFPSLGSEKCDEFRRAKLIRKDEAATVTDDDERLYSSWSGRGESEDYHVTGKYISCDSVFLFLLGWCPSDQSREK